MDNIFHAHPNKDLTHPSVVELRQRFGVRAGEKVYSHQFIQAADFCLLHASPSDPYRDFCTAWMTPTEALPAGTLVPKEYRDGIERPRTGVGGDCSVFVCPSVKAGVEHVINHHDLDRDAPVYFGAFAPEDNNNFLQYAILKDGQEIGNYHELFAVYEGYFATPRAWFVYHPHGNGRGRPTFRYHPNPNMPTSV